MGTSRQFENLSGCVFGRSTSTCAPFAHIFANDSLFRAVHQRSIIHTSTRHLLQRFSYRPCFRGCRSFSSKQILARLSSRSSYVGAKPFRRHPSPAVCKSCLYIHTSFTLQPSAYCVHISPAIPGDYPPNSACAVPYSRVAINDSVLHTRLSFHTCHCSSEPHLALTKQSSNTRKTHISSGDSITTVMEFDGPSSNEIFYHDPFDHAKPSNRLVQLLPELSADGQIQCAITHTTVDATYRCLSYRWGAPSPSDVILINNKTFNVRQNLLDFLSMARENDEGRKIYWIDALCINQMNTMERNHQVAQMG